MQFSRLTNQDRPTTIRRTAVNGGMIRERLGENAADKVSVVRFCVFKVFAALWCAPGWEGRKRLKGLLGVQQNRYRTLIHQFHLHVFLKTAGLAIEAGGLDSLDQ